MTIDWQRFSERVPAGTRVRSLGIPCSGTITSNVPSPAIGYDIPCLPYTDDDPVEVHYRKWVIAKDIEYLIGGVWQSYSEIMEG